MGVPQYHPIKATEKYLLWVRGHSRAPVMQLKGPNLFCVAIEGNLGQTRVSNLSRTGTGKWGLFLVLIGTV